MHNIQRKILKVDCLVGHSSMMFVRGSSSPWPWSWYLHSMAGRYSNDAPVLDAGLLIRRVVVLGLESSTHRSWSWYLKSLALVLIHHVLGLWPGQFKALLWSGTSSPWLWCWRLKASVLVLIPQGIPHGLGFGLSTSCTWPMALTVQVLGSGLGGSRHWSWSWYGLPLALVLISQVLGPGFGLQVFLGLGL